MSNILWLVVNYILCRFNSALISHFEHDLFTLSQNIESSKIGQALNNMSSR